MTEAKAILRVDVQGEKKIDALNRKLEGVGKDAFRDLSTDTVARKLDRVAGAARDADKSLAHVGTGNPFKKIGGEIDATERKASRLSRVFERIGDGLRGARATARSKLANIGRDEDGRPKKIGTAFNSKVQAATYAAWEHSPIGSGAQWAMIDMAARPLGGVMNMMQRIGGLAGPVAGAAAGFATLGAVVGGLGVAAAGTVASIVTLRTGLRGIDLGKDAARSAVGQRQAAATRGVDAQRQAVEENMFRRLFPGTDNETARTRLAEFAKTTRELANGDLNDDQTAAAKRLGLTRKAKRGEGNDAFERMRTALDNAGPAPQKRAKVLRDVQTLYGDEIANGVEANDRSRIRKTKTDAAAEMPKIDFAGAKTLNETLGDLEGKMSALGATIGNSLIPPVSTLFTTLNQKLDGAGGKSIADTISGILGKSVDALTSVVKDMSPEKIEGVANSLRKIFDTIADFGEGTMRRILALIEGRPLDAVGRGGYTKEEEQARADKERERRATDPDYVYRETFRERMEMLDSWLGRKFRTREESEAIARKDAQEAADKVRENNKTSREKVEGAAGAKADADGSVGKFDFAKNIVGDAAEKLTAAKGGIEASAAALPGKGTEAGGNLGDAAGARLLPIGGPLGSSIAGSIIAGMAGFKIPVDTSGVSVPRGSLTGARTGADVPAMAQ